MKPNRRDYTEHGECDCEKFEEDMDAWGDAEYERLKDEKMEKEIEDESNNTKDAPTTQTLPENDSKRVCNSTKRINEGL